MLIFWYLARRFFLFLTGLDLLLAFLFNFIEFFEKLVRAKHVTASTILHFLSLNFIPTVFDVLPISMWLALCLLLKELYQRHEWETLQLLSYIPSRLLTFALSMGLIVSITAFITYESYVSPLAFKAEQFKYEKLKQDPKPQLITNAWLELDTNTFFYCDVLDLKKHQGHRLLVITMNSSFMLHRLIKADYFTVNPQQQTITIPIGSIVEVEEQKEHSCTNMVITAPALFAQLRLNAENQTLTTLTTKLILYKNVLPVGIYNELLGQLFAKMLYYLQLLLYPLVTVCLFMLFSSSYVQWVAALSTYPLFITASVIGDTLSKQGPWVWLMIVPYLILIIFVGIVWFVKIKG